MKTAKTAENIKIFQVCRGNLLATGLFSLVINLLILAGPLYMMQIYDRVLTSGSLPTLTALSVLVGGLLVFMGILELIRSRLLVRVGRRIDRNLCDGVFDRIIRRQLDGRTGSSQPLGDLRTLREFLSGTGPFAFFDAPWVPVYLAVIYLLHPLLFAVAALGAVLLFALALMGDALTRKPMGTSGRLTSDSAALAETGRRNAEALQAMGMIPGLRRRWRAVHDQALAGQNLASDRAGGIAAVSKTLRLILQSAILGVGAALAIDQSLSPGGMIAASIIMGRALAPVDQAIGNWRGFVQARGAYRRLAKLFAEMPEPAQRLALPEAKGHLQVHNLIAAAPGGERAILSGLSFELSAGEALGIIGPSASGKSSLARLLTGVWQPRLGAVRLDGAGLDQWDPQDLGRQVGYLPQDVELFSGTVAENISRFASSPADEGIVAAAKAAGVHDMILALPDGYNTEIGDDGGLLSGGQRQRLGLARALYNDPVLVVLDEPNANLDADGDIALTSAITAVKARGGMAVVIAHRPSAIEAVDRLLVLNSGRQQALGPKEEVLAQVTRNSVSTTGKVAHLHRRPAP